MKAIKICIVLFLILSFVSFSLTVVLCFVRENEKVKRISLEAQVSKLEGDKAGLQLKVQDLATEKAALTEDLDKQKEIVDSYKTKLRDQKLTLDEQTKRLEAIEGELSTMRNEYTEFKKSSSGIIDDYKQQNQELLTRIARMRGSSNEQFSGPSMAPDIPQTVATDPNLSVELAPVVVNPQISVSGKVEVVNRKFNFIISNIGQDDGLKIGDVLNVYRNDKPIGLVRVEKLYDVLSASAIVEERDDMQIQEGDIVGI